MIFLNYDINDFLKSITNIETLKEPFDYSINKNSKNEEYFKELKKFNNLYFSYHYEGGILKGENEKLILKKEDLKQIFKLFSFYKKYDKNKCYLIAEFLLIYYNMIIDKNNKIDTSQDVNELKKLLFAKEGNINFLNILKSLTFEFYDKIVEYGLEQCDFYFVDIIERVFTTLNSDELLKKKLVKKFLENNIEISDIIDYDKNVKENFKYYKGYIINYQSKDLYEIFPFKVIKRLDKEELLDDDIINSIFFKIEEHIRNINEEYKEKKQNLLKLVKKL